VGLISNAYKNGIFSIQFYIEMKIMNDLFGQFLREIYRIISEGDYAAATALVECYGVKVH